MPEGTLQIIFIKKLRRMTMALSRCSFGVLLMLLPLQIPLTPDDSVSTSLQIIGSHGQYAAISRSCEGDVTDKDGLPLTEVGISAQHRVKSWLSVGIDGGVIRSKLETEEDVNAETAFKHQNFTYASPHVDFNASWIGAGVGAVVAPHGLPFDGEQTEDVLPSFHLRLGKPRIFYFDASLCRSLPLSHGYFTMGLGSKASKKTNWWVGISGLPYDGAGLLTRVDFRMSPAVQLTTSLRLGTSEGISENALGIGLRFTH
jgi:hypothetical protein